MNSNALLTDLYQLTMLQGYFDQKMEEVAVFEFFVRDLPPNRNFLMAAGLDQALSYLEKFQFSKDDMEWLASTRKFRRDFINYLGELRFTGDVHAMTEGTLFFANEPILRVTAPMPQAQIVETRLINILQFQTMVASKAARCVLVTPDKTLVDFGLRRAHGADAGLFAARASYLAGFTGTSTVLAGKLWGIPIFGTVAHSFIQAHDVERDAFENFVRANPDNAVFLLDTYDTEAAAELVVAIAPDLKAKGIQLKGVRLDSGDLAEHARKVRKILDDGGLPEVRIIASGALDEFKLEELLKAGAPIDSFGIGTRLDTSADAPQLDCAYKLMEYAGKPRRKRSEKKATWPGRKQVYRSYDEHGQLAGDILTLEGDAQKGASLISQVMRGGKRVSSSVALDVSREHARNELKRLPASLRAIEKAAPLYEPEISRALQMCCERT